MKHDEIITWSALEYEHKEKSADWYWALGVIAVAGSATAFLLGNILLSILIVIGAFTLAMYGRRRPEMMDVKLGKRGVFVNDTLYPYNTLKSFWVEEQDKESKVLIESEKMLMPYIVIPLNDADPDEVREFLFEYLEEEEHSEPLSHKFMEYLGF